MGTVTIVCKSCGNSFDLTYEEAAWYVGHCLCIPSHCKVCRDLRKKNPPAQFKAQYTDGQEYIKAV